MILPKFLKNCIKLRKFLAVGGGWVCPLDPPLITVNNDEMNLGDSQTIKSLLMWMIHSFIVYMQLDIRWILTIWNYL